MKVRIGIDVGGTFTDAVIIDNSTYELIGEMKIPTTHTSREGVAAGIVEVIKGALEKYHVNPEDVVFIAHGTTQATNALLEGDVVPVGIVGMGKGMESLKAKNDTNIGDIELAPGKFLYTHHRYADASKPDSIGTAIDELKQEGSEVIVASAAFAVDDPTTENDAINQAVSKGLLATGSHEISKLYGLKIRTRTAAINASILPKMINTANMTEDSVKKAGIKSPLMIMRCDGGVMDIGEVRKRPILTMLSGPAAGVAGALMYEKISNGIFLEVGGTSTDISAIKDGKVMVDYAEVGGHKTYLNSLDVRTVGVAGGSMVQVDENKGVVGVGPRSAHIAGLDYAVYAKFEDIVDPKVVLFQPLKNDPSNYAAVECSNGKRFAITVSCAANILGLVKPENYAYGNKEAAAKAFKPFADMLQITVEEFAKQIMDKASEKNEVVVKKMLEDYKLDPQTTVLVGGGGGSAAVVPYLAKFMGMEHRIARNAEVISPIGVALAMVRDIVERTILNPTEEDILKLRKEAEQAAIQSGAAPGTVELHVEVDSQRNVVRVIATGATELRTKGLMDRKLSEEELSAAAAKSMNCDAGQVQLLGSTGDMAVFEGRQTSAKFFGLIKTTSKPVRVIDNEGVIRLQKKQGDVFTLSVAGFDQDLTDAVEKCTVYRDGGKEVPDVFLIYGKKMIDLSGLIEPAQILSVGRAEIQGLPDDTKLLALICSKFC